MLEADLALLLDAARARFLPEIAFDARYTRAEGGREIGLPLGTLVKATLPFLASAIVTLMIITYVPEVVLALPRYFGFLD